jgi:hypothetical protein
MNIILYFIFMGVVLIFLQLRTNARMLVRIIENQEEIE